jgi:hypothetical protein
MIMTVIKLLRWKMMGQKMIHQEKKLSCLQPCDPSPVHPRHKVVLGMGEGNHLPTYRLPPDGVETTQKQYQGVLNQAVYV